MGELGGEDVVPCLCDALKDPEWSVRYHAAIGLSRLKSPKSLIPLMQAVFDPNPQVALQVIKALEELKDPRAIDVLRRVATANIPEVSSAAQRVARALQEIAHAKGLPVPSKRRPVPPTLAPLLSEGANQHL